ncbi:hypothetical protein IPM62_02340 [Candidatus Woesebacteria bacterium]|nr:MAG: hypothetical protein IPM62_02340 [Candidatus Woesebacteria bacterium]
MKLYQIFFVSQKNRPCKRRGILSWNDPGGKAAIITKVKTDLPQGPNESDSQKIVGQESNFLLSSQGLTHYS